MADLDAAIRERLALHNDGNYFSYDSETIQGAVFAVLDLHKAVHYHNDQRYEPAYDKDGKHLGYLLVELDRTLLDWCRECNKIQPCATKRAIATGLGIEVET